MSRINRRRFLAAGALAAATVPAVARAQKEPAKFPLKFSLGIVTFNYFGTWTLDEILKMCKTLGIGPV